MGQHSCPQFARVASLLLPLAACLLLLAGCNNTCVSGTPSCVVNTASGILHLEIGAASGVTSAPSSVGPHITHLFVTLAGVDVHSSSLARDDTPGWQPLAQQLQTHPLQVDLLADPEPNDPSPLIPDSVVPAGVYRQVRLRLATQLPGEGILEANHCGTLSPHCAAMSDGRVLSLVFPPSRPDLRLMLESAPGRELYVPPDGTVTLAIQLDPVRSYLWPSGESVLFAPVFRLSVFTPASSAQD